MPQIIILLLVTLFFWHRESRLLDISNLRFHCYLFLTCYWIGMLIAGIIR